MTRPIYAIGDIHGYDDELARVLDLIHTDGGPDAEIVFLGDYTDRGPNSAGVLNTLINGRDAGRPWTCLKGNHDRMFEWFLRDYPQHDAHLPVELYWLHPRLGGETTLASYGVEVSPRNRQLDVHARARAAVPGAHLAFVKSLPLSHQAEGLFFAHAGIRPGVALDRQSEHDLLWIRREFHEDTRDHGKLVVHGHTPVDSATHYGNRVNIDSGAGHGHGLTAVVFEGQDCWRLTAQGRERLTP